MCAVPVDYIRESHKDTGRDTFGTLSGVSGKGSNLNEISAIFYRFPSVESGTVSGLGGCHNGVHQASTTLAIMARTLS